MLACASRGEARWIRAGANGIPPTRREGYDVHMDEEIEAFVAAWLADNQAVLDEIVAIQADDSTTPYGAAVAAAMAAIRAWSPNDPPA